MRNKIISRLQDTKLFWKIWFWWGIRQARKRRIANEKWLAEQPSLTLEEYWEQKNNSK